MSFNDPLDVESALQVPPPPPILPPVSDGLPAQTRPPVPSAQLQQAPTPPTTAGLSPGSVALPNSVDPFPAAPAAPPTPIGVPTAPTSVIGTVPVPGPTTLLPTNAPPGLPSVKPTGLQMVPQVSAATQTVTPLVPGALISSTQTASQQQPTGTMTNISTLSQS